MPSSPASRFLSIAVTVATLAYPFVVYFGLDRAPPRLIGTAMAAVLLLRLTVNWTRSGWAFPDLAWLATGVAFVGLLSLDEALGLRLYPVLVSFGLAIIFGASLYSPPPVIERIARLREPNLPPEAVIYVRRVTKVWLVFFVINGSIAAATAAWGTLGEWTLYNGLISYLMVGLIFATEFIVRQRFRRALRAGR